ncbi:acetyltransferase (GNAT) family protein [Paraburkholderia sp. BL8N3]|jgi:ribosomal protein S18 acetylase RimI-like enzyme|nr:GNAT family N-acetyltransferase [Paraburkholderia sp. BL8N3]TCK36624.1 acetyltransferase (GNAT) family protein [Paraburkholderia sp. BL8N3]
MQLPLSLRPATPNDESFLIRLRKLTMTGHLIRAGEPADDETHLQRVRFRYGDASILMYGADDIGLVKAARSGSEWFIFQLQILPEYQGRGLGGHVLRLMLADAERAGSSVSLTVLKDNPARRLYLDLGFRHVGETDIEYRLTWHP